MSPELIAILAVGLTLAGLTLRMGARLDSRIDRLDTRVTGLEQRMAHLEGLLEGLREAIAGRNT